MQRIAIVGLQALYDACATHLAAAGARIVEYNIALTMHSVASDHHLDDIIDDISDALEFYVLWEQLGSVIVILEPGCGITRGLARGSCECAAVSGQACV